MKIKLPTLRGWLWCIVVSLGVSLALQVMIPAPKPWKAFVVGFGLVGIWRVINYVVPKLVDRLWGKT